MEPTPIASSGAACPRSCDSCRSDPCLVYCHADNVYLCSACDGQLHPAHCASYAHHRVWVCEACQCAPAAFTCKADAAMLCTACDANIHSANPLARRHHRTTVLPVSSQDVAARMPDEMEENDDCDPIHIHGAAASWFVTNPMLPNNKIKTTTTTTRFLYAGDNIDDYLDLGDYNTSCIQTQNQDEENGMVSAHVNHEGRDGLMVSAQLIADSITRHKPSARVSPLSSMDIAHGIPPKSQLGAPMDREARVLRYREKRKMRRFEKTIRYASRKAYAETRPRIKGRFAKRSE